MCYKISTTLKLRASTIPQSSVVDGGKNIFLVQFINLVLVWVLEGFYLWTVICF